MLDNLAQISKLDKENILGSIEYLPQQIRQAWDEVDSLGIPQDYFDAKNVIISGMGGSGLGARIVRYLMFDRLRAPLEYVNHYLLPNYVNSNSLVILSSYSGNTEETISSGFDALKKNAKIFGITTGGKLADFLKKEKLPGWIFNPTANPSGQPRMGLGYSIVSLLAILAKCNFLYISEGEIAKTIESCETFIKEFGVRTPKERNIAKKIAEKYSTKIPVILSAEHLVGCAHTMRNQINENSKTFSASFKISEANHHLLEGLRFPQKAKEILKFIILESPHYYERVQKRFPITEDVIKKNGFDYDVYKTISIKKLEEVFEVLVLGSYISFYLSVLHGIDPSPIPWVDYFKNKMDN